ncbi:MAG: glycosyltransferase [bacterium]
MKFTFASRPKLTISVIIPVDNCGENFGTSLRSISEAVPPPNEIIVVADGGKDDFKNPTKELGIQVLETPIAGGPARSRNLGARKASGDILFFVDADVVIPRDAVSQIATAFRCEPYLVALFGSYDDTPAANNFLSQYKNLFHHYVHQTAREEASTFWGACGAIRRDVFLALGGFDEGYRHPSIEDIELGYRLKRAGYRIQLCKALQVKHLKRWGVVSLLKSDFCHRALPWAELILRDRHFINDLNLKTSGRLSVMFTYGLLSALLGAWWWSGALVVVGVLSLSLLVLNAPLYRFFLRKRGLWFALRAVPWHWFYYFYSGLAFAIGVIQYLFNRRKSPTLDPTKK